MSSFGILIAIIVVVGWVIKGISSAMGNEDDTGRKRPKRSLEEWDELQARRREAKSEQQQALSEMRADSSSQNPAQMTMAERIELARQRARQQAGVQDQGDQQAEALRQAQSRAQEQAERRAREQRESELRARQRRAEQQRAQRERVKQQRRRQQAEQEAQAQAQRQRRAKQQRRSQSKPATRATKGSRRESVVAESMQRIHQGHDHDGPKVTRRSKSAPVGASAAGLGLMDRNALRKAFIMKELLDKPIALRDPQADLPS